VYLHNLQHKHAPEGEGTGTGTGSGEPTKGGDPASAQAAELGVLKQAVGLLAQGFDELKNQGTKMQETLETLAKPKETTSAPITPDKMFEGVDLTQMDNSGLATLVLQKATELVESKLKEHGTVIDGKITSIHSNLAERDVKSQVADLSKEAPDLYEWRPEIQKILGEHTTLSIKDAYILAKSQDAKKSAEMIKKYATKPDVKHFSFAPSGTRSDGGGKMSQADAAAAAFDSVFGGNEHLLRSDTR
jgi:hypothetical protein